MEFQWSIIIPRKEQIRYLGKKPKNTVLKGESKGVIEERGLVA